MNTPASIAGHPIHPMLVPIAIGSWVFALVADIICAMNGGAAPWPLIAYYAMCLGIVGALAAAVPGLIDLLSLPPGPVKKTGILHMSLNLLIVGLFVVNVWMRHGAPDKPGPIGLTVVAILMLLVSGWLGGKLVFEGGVGVKGTP